MFHGPRDLTMALIQENARSGGELQVVTALKF
jgi:hypothetical protein